MEKIQEILNNGLDRYEKEHKIVMYKKKVINAIFWSNNCFFCYSNSAVYSQLYAKLKKRSFIDDGMLFIDGLEVQGVSVEERDDKFEVK